MAGLPEEWVPKPDFLNAKTYEKTCARDVLWVSMHLEVEVLFVIHHRSSYQKTRVRDALWVSMYLEVEVLFVLHHRSS